MDVMTPEQRRKAMQSNRGRTVPERALASLLWHMGLRYFTADGYRSRIGVRFPGQPDLIFTRIKAVVFVDGCFWHGCRRCHDFRTDCDVSWQQKIEGNVRRDRTIRARLRRQGWMVIRAWEHDLRRKADLTATATKIGGLLRKRCLVLGNRRP